MTRKIAVLACAMLLSLSMASPTLADIQRSEDGETHTASASNAITASSMEFPREEQTEDAEPAESGTQESPAVSDDSTTRLLVITVLFGSVLVLGPFVLRGRTHGQGAASDKQRCGS